MKQCASILGLVLACLCLTPSAWGQDYNKMRNELVEKQQNTRAEIERLDEQIDQFQERLSLTERKYDRLLRQYEDLKRVIALQEEKIDRLEQEQQHVLEELAIISRQIEQNEQELQHLINNYKNTLTYIYKHGRTTQLALIFSSESINQMMIRSYYLNKFETYRLNQARQIEEVQNELIDARNRQQEARDQNAAVLAEIQAEKKEQEQKKKLQEKNVKILQRDRRQYQNKIEEAEQEKQKLQNALNAVYAELQRLERSEEERKRKLAEARTIADEEERSRAVARYSAPAAGEGFMDEESLAKMEESFAAQKGSLPWPVNSSTISEHFGSRRHPVYGTVTPNLGIEIVTSSQEPVRVIHDGYVVEVMPITGFGDVVVVKHGRFFTAYGNLSQVMVRKNSVLREGDIIGLAGDESSPRGESVFFMVRENNVNLDPENWISKK